MRIIVAGSRNFTDRERLFAVLDRVLPKDQECTIISGAARGADTLGEAYAGDKRLKLERYPADWDRYGKGAGPKRNLQMAEVADALVAFLLPESRGTRSMIEIAGRKNLKVCVVSPETVIDTLEPLK